MPTTYLFTFTDTSKEGFAVQPYTTDGPRDPNNSLIMDHAVRADTTLQLYGKGMIDYGQDIQQNMVYMLENFASGYEPVYSIEGQLWYNNGGVGSPPAPGELFIRNGTSTWDAVLLATGSSAMTGLLTLSGDPTNALHAATKQYVDTFGSSLTSHIGNNDVHITSDQNTFLDGLNLPSLTSTEVNTLEGIDTTPGTTVQTQLNGKLNLSGGVLSAGANITFSGGGEPLGLPSVPSGLTAAASKQYVDDQISGVTGLTYTASDISFDNTLYPSYPTNLQDVVEYIEVTKADLESPTFTGSVTVNGTLTLTQNPVTDFQAATKQYVDSVAGAISSTIPTSTTIERDLSISPSGSPLSRIFQVPEYTADTNSLFIYHNGIKQYCNTYTGQQTVLYNSSVVTLDALSLTGLDDTIDYHFDVTIDGVGPTLITITAGTPISTHGSLITAILSQFISLSIDGTLEVTDTSTETFKSNNSGSTASIVIADPNTGGSPSYNYLFNVPTPININRPEFTGIFTDPDPINWTIPDTLIITGDVTTSFPVGKTFSVHNSNTDYGSYDGVFSVHTNGATYNSGTGETSIPVASISDSTQAVPLIFDYSVLLTGSPYPSAPVVSAAGEILLTYIGGLTGLGTPVSGLDGDYREITYTGSPLVAAQASPGTTTTWIEYNFDVPGNIRIEVNCFK